jgi:hypothetical protein
MLSIVVYTGGGYIRGHDTLDLPTETNFVKEIPREGDSCGDSCLSVLLTQLSGVPGTETKFNAGSSELRRRLGLLMRRRNGLRRMMMIDSECEMTFLRVLEVAGSLGRSEVLLTLGGLWPCL